MRKATEEDFRRGAKLVSREGTTIVLREKYDDGIWEAVVMKDGRRVGEIVVFEDEAAVYVIGE